MRLSTKSRYGLRAILRVALQYDKGVISISEIARQEGISLSYLEQLLGKLKRQGFVKSLRGSQGGYLLARDPSSISVGEIVRALEKHVAPVSCVDEKRTGSCAREGRCATRTVWKRLAGAINEVLDSTTLEDLCRDAQSEGPYHEKKRRYHEKSLSRQ